MGNYLVLDVGRFEGEYENIFCTKNAAALRKGGGLSTGGKSIDKKPIRS
jgi:hypothetical protein